MSLLEIAHVPVYTKLVVVKYLNAVVCIRGFSSQVACKVIKFLAVGFAEMRFEIHLVLQVVLCFHAKAGIDVGGEQFAIEGLKMNKQLIYRIGFIVNFLIGNGCFIFTFTLRQSNCRNDQRSKQKVQKTIHGRLVKVGKINQIIGLNTVT